MLLATRSSDSIRARSPLAAMAVMGSMRKGKGTARANRRWGYNFLKRRRIPPKRRIGKPAVRGKSLPDRARRAIFCRATRDQLLENAHRPVWPSSCNFRRVAALAVPPSLVAQPSLLVQSTRVSTPGAEATAAAGGIFPELLAALAPAPGAVTGGAPATSSDAAPRLDTPAGIETLLR